KSLHKRRISAHGDKVVTHGAWLVAGAKQKLVVVASCGWRFRVRRDELTRKLLVDFSLQVLIVRMMTRENRERKSELGFVKGKARRGFKLAILDFVSRFFDFLAGFEISKRRGMNESGSHDGLLAFCVATTLYFVGGEVMAGEDGCTSVVENDAFAMVAGFLLNEGARWWFCNSGLGVGDDDVLGSVPNFWPAILFSLPLIIGIILNCVEGSAAATQVRDTEFEKNTVWPRVKQTHHESGSTTQQSEQNWVLGTVMILASCGGRAELISQIKSLRGDSRQFQSIVDEKIKEIKPLQQALSKGKIDPWIQGGGYENS
ncbi:hypothetical protein V8G54_019050, partial [Vigna mungo]